MFNSERWQEIFQSLKKNKLNTFLIFVQVKNGSSKSDPIKVWNQVQGNLDDAKMK